MTFDYIIAIKVLEQSTDPVKTLKTWKCLLNPKGRMLLGAENRLGLKYFCGEKDPFTNRCFDGLTNYQHALAIIKEKGAKAYTKSELVNFFQKAELPRVFYSSPYGLDFAQLLYREDHLPLEELSARATIKYNSPDTIFLEEEAMYSDIIQNGMFHTMANGFLIEVSLNGEFSNVLHVTSSVERGRKKALSTIIKEDVVIKKALYKEAREHLKILDENTRELICSGVNMIEGKLEGDSYIMPFFKGENMVMRLKRLFYEDRNKMITEMDNIRNIVMNSSEHVSMHSGIGVKLRKCFIDLTIVNCIYQDNQYYFFDQEVYVETVAATAIVYRNLLSLYMADANIGNELPMEFFLERYHMTEHNTYYKHYNLQYVGGMQNGSGLRDFWIKHRKNTSLVTSNRAKASYSPVDYKKLFIDLLNGCDTKKVILFGSGKFATHFLSLNKNACDIKYVLDNNPSRWGETLEDIPIRNPDLLKAPLEFDYKVIICVKDYEDIVNQLEGFGVTDYCIYDKNLYYA